MNDTTFQGCGKISYVPVVFNPCNKPQTNADRIRSMSDEELEDFLDRWGLGDIDYSKTFCDMCDGQFDCHECRLDWLKHEATE